MSAERLPSCTGGPAPAVRRRPAARTVTRTAVELSVVCPDGTVPAGARAERRWAVLALEGPFPFDLVGVLAAFLVPLAEAGVGIFALSTFDTDYVLVKRERLGAALEALSAAGHVRTGPGA